MLGLYCQLLGFNYCCKFSLESKGAQGNSFFSPPNYIYPNSQWTSRVGLGHMEVEKCNDNGFGGSFGPIAWKFGPPIFSWEFCFGLFKKWPLALFKLLNIVQYILKQEILSIVVANSWANDFIATWRRSSLSVSGWWRMILRLIYGDKVTNHIFSYNLGMIVMLWEQS